ncbi:MAG: phage minor head protein [Desulfuromonadaceae bacterium]
MQPLDLSFAFGLPPEKAIEYFRAKGYTIGWDWRETLHEAHARAFTVAKVMKVDVLEDIRGAVDRALHDGLTLADFKKDLIPTLQKKGWWGEITHPETGEPAFIDARRLTTIYQTNLQTAYMTGRYQGMMENSSKRPYWMYVSILDGRTRPAHKAMNGKIFRFDDPIWNTIYPQNGFRCRCRVRALSESDLAGRSPVLSSAGRLDSIEVAMGKDDTFTTVSRYRGVDDKGKAFTFSPDPGWSYNPGKAGQQHLEQVLRNKVAGLPAGIRTAVLQPVMPVHSNGVLSKTFMQAIDDTLSVIPESIQDTIEKYGYTVNVGPTLVDIHPRLAGKHPRGWDVGTTWENVEGVHNRKLKQISIGEQFVSKKTGLLIDNTRVEATLRHELGHAADMAFGTVSDSTSFIQAYHADVAALPTVASAQIDYLLQSGKAGREETFAEIFAEIHGGGNSSYNLAGLFPQTTAIIKKVLVVP